MAERRKAPKRTWLAAAAATTAGLLACGFTQPQHQEPPAGRYDPTPPAPDVGGKPTPQATGTPSVKDSITGAVRDTVMGAYLDFGPQGITRIAGLEKWLGGTDLKVGHTYLPGDLWSNIEGKPGFLDAWAKWRKAQPDRLFVLNVPMLDDNEGGVSDYQVRQRLSEGAAGAYDHHFRTLAERLVNLGVPDTVIVLGWEMNGATYTHRCGPDPEAWKTYWKRIVTAMRAVPGQKFKFDFAPNRGRDAVPWTTCYPGDDVVDVVGMDSYDQPPGRTFQQQANEPFGLQQQVDFAAKHKKPISYPEWGLFRNGDNPAYMRGMLDWIDKHKPLYQTITDYCPHGVWQCNENPASSKVFRSKLSLPPTPVPEPTVPPTTPTQPPSCMPLELGSWVEYWMGGKLCLRFDWLQKWR
ncbi:glycosyl hydrolase [Streptomyces sp. NPDC050738]|uniref:glycosyl hydrolase n=1 Tax=Streptomyces sp. NPDC050738 TaxID=3154744 RepID=UPI0034182447